MKSKIYKNELEDEEGTKEAFLQSLRFRKILISILEKDLSTKYDVLTKEDDYSSPSWSLMKADALGEIRETKRIISLLSSS